MIKIRAVALVLIVLMMLNFSSCCSTNVEDPVLPTRLSAWLSENMNNFKDEEWMRKNQFSVNAGGMSLLTYDMDGERKMYYDSPYISIGINNCLMIDSDKPFTESGKRIEQKVSDELKYYYYDFDLVQSEDVYFHIRIDVGMHDLQTHDAIIDNLLDVLFQKIVE